MSSSELSINANDEKRKTTGGSDALRQVSQYLLGRRGLLIFIPTLIIGWYAQLKFTPDATIFGPPQRLIPGADPDLAAHMAQGFWLYVVAISLLIIGLHYTYRTKTFIRLGNYQETTLPHQTSSPDHIDASIEENHEAVIMDTKPTLSSEQISETDQSTTPKIKRPTIVRRQIAWWRFALVALALLACYYASSGQSINPYDFKYYVAWFAGIVLLALACIRQRRDVWPTNLDNPQDYGDASVDEDGWRDSKRAFMSRKLGWAIVGLVILFVIVVRLYDIGNAPYGAQGDETELALHSVQILHGNYEGWPLLGPSDWYFYPAMGMYVKALGIALLGQDSFVGMRLTDSLAGIIAVFFFYLLLRELFKGRTALIGALLLAAGGLAIFISRDSVGGEYLDTCRVACFYFIFRGLRSKRYLDFALAGLAAGLGSYFYPSSHLTIPIVVALFLYLAVTRWTFLRDYWSHALTTFLGIVVSAAPFFAWVFANPAVLTDRLNNVGILGDAAATAFQRWGVPYTTPMPDALRGGSPSVGNVIWLLQHWAQGWGEVIWRQTVASFTSINYQPDVTVAYTSGTGIFTGMMAVFAVIGIGYFLWRWRDPRYFLFILILGVGLFVGLALTNNAPNYLRLAGIDPFLYAFPAVLLNKMIYEMERSGWFSWPGLASWWRYR